ncbi:MAG TPA: hypothetical protein ENK43_12285 [Planctomycetes bacterium]|nr:hypothetical protein [Planctomycetota bacterium]
MNERVDAEEGRDGKPASDLRGLRRFHKVTVGAGIVFVAMMCWRFTQAWLRDGSTARGLYGLAAGIACVLLVIYWLRFNRRGL